MYQSYCWYAFIRQDFLMYYRYSQKWIDLFEAQPLMKEVETGHYIKGVHNMLNAFFDLRYFERFETVLKKFETFARHDRAKHHDNFRTHTSIYSTGQNKLAPDERKFQEGLRLCRRLQKNSKNMHCLLISIAYWYSIIKLPHFISAAANTEHQLITCK